MEITLLVFEARSNHSTLTDPALPDRRNEIDVLDFSDSANTVGIFSAILPRNYDGGGIDIILTVGMTTAVAGTLDVDARFMRIGTVQNVDVDGFGPIISSNANAVSPFAGVPIKITIAVNSDFQRDFCCSW